MAEFACFREERLLIFDYLVVDEDHRRHGEYCQFMQVLRQYIRDERLEFDFAVAEVSYESAVASKSSRQLVRLFMREGFSVADCRYHSAVLGLSNPESDIGAHLMISSRQPVASVARDVLLRIVHTIYFLHNERWYFRFIPEKEGRERYHNLLKLRFEQFQDSLRGGSEIKLNGLKIVPGPVPPLSPARRRRVRKERFDVALTFPGDLRSFVEEVANSLARILGRERVFYDRWYEHELAVPDLDAHLQDIYHNKSLLVLVFLSEAYESREWCRVEWRPVRDLLKRR